VTTQHFLSRTLVVVVALVGNLGCSGEPEAELTKEKRQQRQIERARAMEQEVGR
jgi:hypothetical protein